MTVLIWYRNDLRLHDHQPLYEALRQKEIVVPLYCFDPRQFGQTHFGFPKTGAYRARFLLESVADLRRSLRQLGSNLLIRRGKPEEIIPTLVQELGIDSVYWHEEVTTEELAVEQALEAKLEPLGIRSQIYWGAALYHPDNLPFAISRLPEVFTQFRKKVERDSSVDAAFPAPDQLPSLPNVDIGKLPNLKDLGLHEPEDDDRAVLRFEGGEAAANTLRHRQALSARPIGRA